MRWLQGLFCKKYAYQKGEINSRYLIILCTDDIEVYGVYFRHPIFFYTKIKSIKLPEYFIRFIADYIRTNFGAFVPKIGN